MGVKIPTMNDIYHEAGRAADQVGDMGEAIGTTLGAAGSGLEYTFKDIEKRVGSLPYPVINTRLLNRLSIDFQREFFNVLVFLSGPWGATILSAFLGPVFMAIILSYFAYLDAQAVARLRPLPRKLRDEWQPLYPSVDLALVRYAEEIDTVHGLGITVGLRIYFPRKLDLDTKPDLHFLAHELQHCVQYVAVGGVGPFLGIYFVEVAQQVIVNRSFNVHNLVGLEVEAEKKAVSVEPVYGA
jgi:hypothetical protein